MSETLKLTSEKILEVSSNSDVMTIRFISTKARPNLNDCHFTSEFLRARASDLVTPNQMPITIDYDEYNNAPKGHGLTPYGELMAMPIGYFTKSVVELDENGVEQLVNEVVIWKDRFPSIANCIYDLHLRDMLRFSIECKVADYDWTDDGIRIPKIEGAKFIGVAIVDEPAEPGAKSLMVASLEEDLKLDKSDNKSSDLDINNSTNGGAEMEELQAKIDELMKLIEDKDVEINSLKEQVEKAQKDNEIKELNEKIDELNGLVVSQKEQIVEFENKVNELNSQVEELKPYKEQIEQAEKDAKKNALVEKFSKLISKETFESERVQNAIEEGNETELNSVVVEEVSKNVKVETAKKDGDVVIATPTPEDLIPQSTRDEMYAPVSRNK